MIDIKMRALYAKKHWKGLKLDASPYDKCTQDVILNKGVPIISKVNSEEMNLVNNQLFVIAKVGPLQITVKDDSGKEEIFIITIFKDIFLLHMLRLFIVHKVVLLVKTIQFMSGID